MDTGHLNVRGITSICIIQNCNPFTLFCLFATALQQWFPLKSLCVCVCVCMHVCVCLWVSIKQDEGCFFPGITWLCSSPSSESHRQKLKKKTFCPLDTVPANEFSYNPDLNKSCFLVDVHNLRLHPHGSFLLFFLRHASARAHANWKSK